MNFKPIVSIGRSEFSPPRPLSMYPEESRREATILLSDMAAPGLPADSCEDVIMQELLRQHQKMASGAIVEHDGVVMKFFGAAILASFHDPKDALEAALKIQERFHRFNDGRAPQECRHNRISMHHGECIIEGQELFGDAGKVAAGLLAMAGKGEILISETAYEAVKELSHLYFEQVNRIGSEMPPGEIVAYLVNTENVGGENGPEAPVSGFTIARTLPGEGVYSPCFYCGDRRHPTEQCPSKQVLEMTDSLPGLGYLPVEHILNRFSDGGLGEDPDSAGISEPEGEYNHADEEQGYLAFLELRGIFQLRFFRAIWNYDGEKWRRRGEWRNDGERGGLVWIAQDCIRVSNLEQAKSILDRAMERHPHDYRTWCTLGFLSIEKSDIKQAKYYFKRALERTKTKPQRIYVLFLLSRLYDLAGDTVRAEERIRAILSLDPSCSEAVYRHCLYLFRKGKQKRAAGELLNLIRTEREYFVVALLDPELTGFSEHVFPELGTLVEETHHEAGRVVRKAEGELRELEKVAESGDRDLEIARSLWANIEELSSTDSYFSSLDCLHFGNSIVTVARRVADEKRRGLIIRLRELRPRSDRCRAFLHYFPYGFLAGSACGQLRAFQKNLEETSQVALNSSLENFRRTSARATALSRDLDRLERKLKGLDGMRRFILFSVKFLIKTVIFQSTNLLVFLVVFPLLVHAIAYLVPGFDMDAQSVGTYQKLFTGLGGICGLVMALIMTARSVSEE